MTTDYEKRYNEALERAKRWADGTLQPERTTPQGVCEAIFPELAESEDEKTRKEIISALKYANDDGTYTKHIAWLEKHKDQKPISSCDIVPYIDDKIAALQDMWREEKVAFDWDDMHEMIEDVARHFYQKEQKPIDLHDKIEELCSEYPINKYSVSDEELSAYHQGVHLGATKIAEYLSEQKPAEWSEIDRNYLNSVINRVHDTPDGAWESCIGDTIESWLKDLQERFNLQPKAEWSEEDKEILNRIIADIEYERTNTPVTVDKDIRQYDKEIDWLKSLRPQKLDASKLENFDPVDVLNRIKTEWPMAWEKVVGEQEWSEEDERMFALLEHITLGLPVTPRERSEIKNWLSNRLKSLRPQPHWKPTEEQMEALKKVTGNADDADEYYPALATLYYDLKEQF